MRVSSAGQESMARHAALDDGSETPVESLLGLPLDGVLNSGSLLRVASALGALFGVIVSAEQTRDLSTFGDVVDLIENAVARPTSSRPNGSVTTMDLETSVRKVLLDHIVAKTGYPIEMLSDDLDLEADLGIDTVKQVEIFARTREHFGIARDPALKLRDFNTIRKVTRHIAAGASGRELPDNEGRSAANPMAVLDEALAPPRGLAAPAAPLELGPWAGDALERIEAQLLDLVVHRTGYPRDMLGLDLDLEADLGIDTVKQVEIFGQVRESFGIERDSKLVLRDFNTLRKYAAYLQARLPGDVAPTVAPTFAQVDEAPSALLPPSRPRENGARPRNGLDADDVLTALLSMSFLEMGITAAERRRLVKTLGERLRRSSPEADGAASLRELVEAFDPAAQASRQRRARGVS